jgi:branched-chain amino acid transport system substrate-binding protein
VRVAGPFCLIVIENMLLLRTAGPLINGIVDYNFGLPWSGLASPASLEFLKEYQAGAGAQGIDALGYYLPPFAYAYMQVLQQAVQAAQSLNDDKLADALRKGAFGSSPACWRCSSRT